MSVEHTQLFQTNPVCEKHTDQIWAGSSVLLECTITVITPIWPTAFAEYSISYISPMKLTESNSLYLYCLCILAISDLVVFCKNSDKISLALPLFSAPPL